MFEFILHMASQVGVCAERDATQEDSGEQT